MENLKSHPTIKEFLGKFPESQHNSYILGLCLIGIETVKSRKETSLFNQPSTTEPQSIPSLQQKIKDMKDQLVKINESLHTTSDSMLTEASVTNIEKPKEYLAKLTPEKTSKKTNALNRANSVIEIADSFMSTGIIKEIYNKEIISERLKVPFRKKWDEACKEISGNYKETIDQL